MENQFLDGCFVRLKLCENYKNFYIQQLNEQRRIVDRLLNCRFQSSLKKNTRNFILFINIREDLNGLPLFDEVIKELKDHHWEVQLLSPDGDYSITPLSI